jgi:uncharacterized delta-60 repeat protein
MISRNWFRKLFRHRQACARQMPKRHLGQAQKYRPSLTELEDRCLLSPGALDTTFGSSGLITGTSGTFVPNNGLGVYSNTGTNPATDGKIVIAVRGPSTSNHFQLARYNHDGTIDTTFGSNGIVSTVIGSNSAIYGLALQSDGKIVAVGSAKNTLGDSAFAIARYNADGSLDTAFGSGGTALTTVATAGNGAFPKAVVIQSDGKIDVAGTATVSGTQDFSLVRYNIDGSLDAAFGPNQNGIVITPNFGTGSDAPWDATVQSDGKIIVPGTVVGTTGLYNMAVARYTTDGLLDTTFNAAGTNPGVVWGLLSSGATQTYAEAVHVETSNGAIVISGTEYFGTTQKLLLARLTSAGQLDTTFGGSGTGFGPSISMLNGYGIVQATNGDLLVCGRTGVSGNNASYQLAAAAYMADGTLDTTFGTGAIASAVFSGAAGYGQAIALQSDGDLVVGGYTIPSGTTTAYLALARFMGWNTAPTITTSSLLNWTVSQAGYSQTISATGGSGAITFSKTAGTLPTGLTVRSTGVLSGTPTAAGTFTFTITATDSANATGSQSYTVTINPAVSITTSTLPAGTVNQPIYSQTISATGGTTPLTFTSTGTLPPGLTLSSAGVLSGIPTTAGSFPFTVTASDSVSATAKQSYTLIINPPVAITTTTLANGTVNQQDYSQIISVTGGSGTYTFSQAGGTLPPGLTLSSTGVLAGTPTTAGGFTFTVTAMDSLGASGTQNFTVMVLNLGIGPSTLANWTLNQPGYSQTLTASGGTAPFTFSATGTLPTGLTLTGTGILSGTPTAAGSFNFVVTVTDSTSAMASQSYTVTINPSLAVSTTSLADWTVNLAGYSQTIAASGGTGAKTFAKTSGTLPTGLTLSSAGVLSGTPTAAGSFTFTITVTDATAASTGQSFSVTIHPPVAISTTTLANWTANLAGYSQTITATGGTGASVFATTAGTLPSGLTLSSAGVLAGTPTAAGSFGFTVAATDMVGAVGSQTYTVLINPALSFASTTLANWTVNQAGYNQTISASGGTGAKTFSISSGTVPTALTLSSNGVLAGTPTAAGNFSFTVTVTDALGASASKNFPITINPAPAITTTSLANWTAAYAGYLQTIHATGGTGALTFTQTGATVPGLTLARAGVLSGTPTTAGSFPFTITATDSLGASGSQNYTVSVNPSVSVTTTSLANWAVAVSGYAQTISASGGTGALTFRPTAGALPGGLTLDSASGILAGTPTAVGSYTFTVTARDSIGATGSKSYTVTINPTPTITTMTLANWTVAQEGYLQTISASGGTGSLAFSQTAGTLPTGLLLSSSGVLSGTPTATGSFTFTVAVSDTLASSARKTFTVIISAPATHFLVSAPGSAAANGFVNVTVTAEDASNQVSAGYTGTVHFSSTDNSAFLPADSTLTSGVGTFAVTLRTLGAQTITVMDASAAALTGTTDSLAVVSPSTIIVAPGFTGPAGATVDGHTIGFDAFATIGQAIQVVSAGGTVYINAATYHESLTLNKSITLQASGSGNAFLMGPGKGTGLTISGASVSVGGLTVENFAVGLSAGSATEQLLLSDVSFTGNAAGGSIAGVGVVAFMGSGPDETLVATATQFGRSGDNVLSYSGVGSLALDGNGGTNTLDLSGASGAVAVTLTGPGSVTGLAGAASIPGLIFTNIKLLEGNGVAGTALAGLNAAASWTINGSMSQYSSSGQTMGFKDFATLYGGAAVNNFAIHGASKSGLIVNGHGDGDSFQVFFGDLAGPVTLSDFGGGNTATLEGTSADDSIIVNPNAVTWNNSESVNYTGLQSLTVDTGAGADAAAVQGTAPATPTTIRGSGSETFLVGSPTGLLDGITSPLALIGGSGQNYLYVSEAKSTTADTVYVTDTAILSGTGTFAPIQYGTMTGGSFNRGVIVVLGSGDNNLRVYSTAAGDNYGLYSGNGNSTIVLTSPTSTLDTMRGPIAVVAGSGSNLLYVSEAGSSTADTLSLSATCVQSTAGFALSYTATGGTFGRGVFLVTGSANNTVRIYGTAAGSVNGINLGNGDNTVVITSPTATLSTMAGRTGVQGGSGNNLLYISDAGSTRPDNFFISGVSVQDPSTGFFVSYATGPGGSFGRGVDVVGGNGNNQMVVVGQLAGSPLSLFGGSGNDRIVAYVTTITFYNLTTDGQGGSNLLYVVDLSGGGMEQISLAGASSGRLTITYAQGLPSILSFNDLAIP